MPTDDTSFTIITDDPTIAAKLRLHAPPGARIHDETICGGDVITYVSVTTQEEINTLAERAAGEPPYNLDSDLITLSRPGGRLAAVAEATAREKCPTCGRPYGV